MHKHDFDAGGRLENSSSLCTHPSHPSLHTLSLGVSIHGSDGHSGTLRHESLTRSTTRNSRLAAHAFPPSIYFSLFFLRSSFSFSSSGRHSLSPSLIFSFLLSRVFPFSAFPARHSAPYASYSPVPHSAALHNFYRCR